MTTENLLEASSDEAAMQALLAPATDNQGETDGEEVEAEEAETMAEPDAVEADGEAEADEDADEDNLDEDDDAEPEGDDEADEDEALTFEVKTVDGFKKVSKDELVEGYMLKADYTRKTMEVAEQRKEVAKAREELEPLKEQLLEALSVWAVPTEQEPDWKALAQQMDPREFNLARVQWDERKAQQAQAAAMHYELRKQEADRIAQQEMAKLSEFYPEFKDPDKYTAAASEMTQTLADYGFSKAEAMGILDHRIIRVLRDAMEFRKMATAKSATAKKVAKAPQRLKPGAKSQKQDPSKVVRQQKLDKLKQTGSIEDALSALLS